MEAVRSIVMFSSIAAGMVARRPGRSCFTASMVERMLAPDWRKTTRETDGLPLLEP